MARPATFSKILVANRGEIALRVMRTARRMGYRTVAVYSSADAGAPHVAAADQAVCIGPPPAAESYLDIAKIVAAAERVGAGAVHPGYGFLSENAAFARACAAAGIVFIGPPAGAIELMGNKARAKRAMAAAGVPCVPGSDGADASDEALLGAAEKIGFPVLIKAAAGGGGRGMRLVHGAGELEGALGSARHEAKSAFGSDELLLEKAIVAPRHVEVQIFGDSHGNLVHLGERDCSVQRRHQKVIEESPSPAVDGALRDKMGAAAVLAGKSCGYTGAGTVELLLAQDGAFYFLEMNTRLQVEHPVTEMVTGLDLVAWQIRVARGEPLPKKQAEIALSGHSIEARLYAEDPARDYLPQTGTVAAWRPAAAPGPRLRGDDELGGDVRFDAGVAPGSVISPYYDPMIAKVVVHAPTRDEARHKLAAALRDTTLFGVVTNKTFLANVLDHPGFAAGATTAFLASFDDPSRRAAPPPPEAFALAALCAYLDAAAAFEPELVGWHSGSPIWSTLLLAAGDARRELRISRAGERRFEVRGGDSPLPNAPAQAGEGVAIEVVACADGEVAYLVEGVRRRARYLVGDQQVWLDDGRTVHVFDDLTHRPAAREAAGTGKLCAPLDGKVVDLRAAPGDLVERGQLLLVIEAMKMEHRIAADIAGEIAAIHVARGQQVKIRQPLVDIAAATQPGSDA